MGRAPCTRAASGRDLYDRSGVSSDRRPPPTFAETELPSITLLEFVVARGEDGQPTLDAVSRARCASMSGL